MATDPHGRGTKAWRRLAAWTCRPQPHGTCWICGTPIVYGLRPRHTLGPSADHVIPVSKGGALLDPNNVRLAHYGCNCDKKDTIIIAGQNNSQSKEW